MFLKDNDYGGPAHFRPAVHDSDGLAVWNAHGERLWRPLVSPRQLQNTTLLEDDLRGFGLIQRSRSFAAYEDLETNYHTRPSAWVEPRKPWGDGAVQLVEFCGRGILRQYRRVLATDNGAEIRSAVCLCIPLDMGRRHTCLAGVSRH